MGEATRARLQIMAGALLFSSGGVAIKLCSFTGWQISSFRCGVAALAMLVCLPKARRGWSRRTLLVAFPYAATFILYTLANKATTAANAIFLQDTAPLYLLLLSPLLLGERIRRRDLALMGILAFGLVLIFTSTGEPLASAPQPRLGNTLAVAAGVSWALTILGLRWIALRGVHSGEQPAAAVVGGCLLAFVVSGLFAFPLEASTLTNWAIVAYLGVFQIGLAYAFITEGMRSVSALESSLLLLIEPVFVPIWAWLLLAEAPGGLALGGGALIIIATVLNTARRGGHAPPRCIMRDSFSKE